MRCKVNIFFLHMQVFTKKSDIIFYFVGKFYEFEDFS